MALAGAYVLAQELGRLPIEPALAAHERRLRPVIDSLQPVSYTHLDVYKRQGWAA